MAAAPTTGKSSLQQMDQLLRWCIERHGLPASVLEPAEVEVQGGEGALRLGFTVSRPVEQGEVSSDSGSTSKSWGQLLWDVCIYLRRLCSREVHSCTLCPCPLGATPRLVLPGLHTGHSFR